jgi:hypothetical protein
MGGLLKNIATEIDTSREQMFLILESIASLEVSKDPQTFLKEREMLKKTIEDSWN